MAQISEARAPRILFDGHFVHLCSPSQFILPGDLVDLDLHDAKAWNRRADVRIDHAWEVTGIVTRRHVDLIVIIENRSGANQVAVWIVAVWIADKLLTLRHARRARAVRGDRQDRPQT